MNMRWNSRFGRKTERQNSIRTHAGKVAEKH